MTISKTWVYCFMRSIFLLCSFLLVGTFSRGQKTIQSPNISSLGLFGEVPVSYYTGIPSIHVPLYSVSEGNITVPLSLDYHASGFRPDVHPGWVGSGWALSCGGFISRKVNGLPDDSNIPDNAQNTQLDDYPYIKDGGYFFIHGILDKYNWEKKDYISSIQIVLRDTRNIDIAKPFLINKFDLDPDEFYFSLPTGVSGKFFMDMDGNWKIDCKEPVKVILDNQFLSVPFNAPNYSLNKTIGYPKTFGGFSIIDADGIKYVFGGNNDYIEYSIDFEEQSKNVWQADAWYLKEIVDLSGRKMAFHYQRGEYINQLSKQVFQDFGTSARLSSSDAGQSCSTEYSPSTSFSGRLISPIYISSINGVSSSIVFNKTEDKELAFGRTWYSQYNQNEISLNIYGNIYLRYWGLPPYAPNNRIQTDLIFPFLKQYEDLYPYNKNSPSRPINPLTREYALWYLQYLRWYKLSKIDIYNQPNIVAGIQGIADPIRTFSFSYTENYNQRLQLDAVREIGLEDPADAETGENTRTYGFLYNQGTANLPYFADMVDHWGFYNGVASHLTNYIISNNSYYLDTVNYNQSRISDFKYAKQGVLQKITYPTGGYTEFEYEGNTCGQQISVNRLVLEDYNNAVGGLRIKKITSNSGPNTGNKIQREFFYLSGYSNNQPYNLRSSGILGGKSQYLFKGFRDPIITTPSSTGYSEGHFFSTVSVLPQSNNSAGSHIGYSEVTEKNSDGSYSKMFFTNFNNGHMDEAGTKINMTESPYDAYSSLEAERGLQYRVDVYGDHDNLLQSKETEFASLVKSDSYAPAIRASYGNTCIPGTLTARINAYRHYTYQYLPNQESVTEYDQGSGIPLRSTISYTYTGNHVLPAKTASTDSRGNAVETSYIRPYDLASVRDPDGVYKSMVEKNVVRPVVEQQNKRNGVWTSIRRTNYATFNGKLQLPESLEETLLPNAPPTIPPAMVVPLEKRRTFSFYDEYGNLLETEKTGDIKENYVWGYNSLYPVAKILGSSKNAIENAGFSGLSANNYDEPTMSSMFNALRTGNATKASDIYSYTYIPNVGMTSETAPNGNTTYYRYDGMGRLSSIKDKNENILKVFRYNYAGVQQIEPIVIPTIPIGTTVYARLSYENADYAGEGVAMADIVARFYIDEECTMPVAVSNLEVNFSRTDPCIETILTGGTLVDHKTANGHYLILYPSARIEYPSPIQPVCNLPPQECQMRFCNIEFELENGTGYKVIPEKESQTSTPSTNPVYVKISYENMDILGNVDVVARFYSDQACTLPVTVTNMDVAYDFSNSCGEEVLKPEGGFSNTANGNYVTLESSVQLTYLSIGQLGCNLPPQQCIGISQTCNIEYYLKPKPEYIIVP